METAQRTFRCMACGVVDAPACHNPDCPDRPELAPAIELKCMACVWQGMASQTTMFGSVSMLCPECGAATTPAELEESVLAGLGAVAVACADTHPQLTAAIVAQIAPDNVDVLDTRAAEIAAGLPHAKEVFARLAAPAYARTSLENVQDVLQAIGKLERVAPALRPTLIGDGTGATRVVPGTPGRCDQSTPLASEAPTYNKAAVSAVTDLERFAKQCPGADIGHVAQLAVNVQVALLNLPATHVFSRAAHDVMAERQRQVSVEGWTPEHDDEHVNDEIAALATFYAMPPAAREWNAESTGYGETLGIAILPPDFDLPKSCDRRRELVKAGALIVAEIERLDRSA